LGRTS